MPLVRQFSKVSRDENGKTCSTITRSCTKRSSVRNLEKNQAMALWSLKEQKTKE